MSVEKNGGRYTFQCDGCSEAVATNLTDFHEALTEAKSEGFIAYSQGGIWFHKCADCKGERP